MQKIIEDLKAAIAAEKTKTPHLAVVVELIKQVEARLANHAADTATPTAAPTTTKAGQ